MNLIYHKTTRLFPLFLFVLLFSFVISGCKQQSSEAYITKSDFKLNTYITITIYDSTDQSLLDECMNLCDYYENILSRTKKDSELYQLNQGLLSKSANGYDVSTELSDLLESGLYYSSLTNGAFDVTIEPITSLWNFTSDSPFVPVNKLISDAVAFIDYKNISISQNSVSFAKEGMGLDLGAIAKGYIADQIKEYLLEKGVKSSLINLGGNVLCIGEKPDSTAFKIGIQKPFADHNETIAVMDIKDMSVVSSGIYERCFTADQKLYHHILNPKTGYPYDNKLVSVTIISKKSVDGDGLSTSCFALGLEKGMELINKLEDTYAIFITDDYSIHYSEGFERAITITE